MSCEYLDPSGENECAYEKVQHIIRTLVDLQDEAKFGFDSKPHASAMGEEAVEGGGEILTNAFSKSIDVLAEISPCLNCTLYKHI